MYLELEMQKLEKEIIVCFVSLAVSLDFTLNYENVILSFVNTIQRRYRNLYKGHNMP